MKPIFDRQNTLSDVYARHEKTKSLTPAEYGQYLREQANEKRLAREANQIVESVHLPKGTRIQSLAHAIARWMLSLPSEDLMRSSGWRMEEIELAFEGHDSGSIGKALRGLGWIRIRRADPSPVRSDYLHRWFPPGAAPEIKPSLTPESLRAFLGPKIAPVKVDVLRREFSGLDGRPPKRSAITQCLRQLGFEQRRDALSLRWWAPISMQSPDFHRLTCPGTRAPNIKKSTSPTTPEVTP